MTITQNKRLMIDALIVLGFVLSMSYSLIGKALHEWVGLATLALFMGHLGLNARFFAPRPKARGNRLRRTMLLFGALLVFVTLGLTVSSLLLSKYALAFLPFSGGTKAATPHQICAYWGFLVMGLHLGLHWSAVGKTLLKKLRLEPYAPALRYVGLALALAGVVCLFAGDTLSFMTLQQKAAPSFVTQSLGINLATSLSLLSLTTLAGSKLKAWLVR